MGLQRASSDKRFLTRSGKDQTEYVDRGASEEVKPDCSRLENLEYRTMRQKTSHIFGFSLRWVRFHCWTHRTNENHTVFYRSLCALDTGWSTFCQNDKLTTKILSLYFVTSRYCLFVKFSGCQKQIQDNKQ